MEALKAINAKLANYVPEHQRNIVDEITKTTLETTHPQDEPVTASWKGLRFPPGFFPETAQYAYEKHDYGENSIVVATYPKTGTTWMVQLLKRMLYEKDEKLYDLCKLFTPMLYYLESNTHKKFELIKNFNLPRMIYGSHLTEDLVNVEKITKQKGKFIIVMRNPKDTAVSFFHFLQQHHFDAIRNHMPSEWSEFLQALYQGKLPYSRDGEWYPDHILGWYKHKNDDNFLFLFYEDMKKDYPKEIRKIAKFLDIDLSEERVTELSESTSFSGMKKESESSPSKGLLTMLSEAKFLRKGQVGSWKEMFTVAQSEMMDRIMEEKLKDTDIKFTFQL